MNTPILLIFICCFFACTISPNKIESEINTLGKIEKIEVNLSALQCDCPQWIIVKNNRETSESIYLEQSDNSLIKADTLYDGTNMPIVLLLEGNYYSKLGIPKDYRQIKRAPDTVRVFRYTKITILSKG